MIELERTTVVLGVAMPDAAFFQAPIMMHSSMRAMTWVPASKDAANVPSVEISATCNADFILYLLKISPFTLN